MHHLFRLRVKYIVHILFLVYSEKFYYYTMCKNSSQFIIMKSHVILINDTIDNIKEKKDLSNRMICESLRDLYYVNFTNFTL